MNKNNKVYSNDHVRITFYSEIAAGVSANTTLLAFHIRRCLLRQRPRLTDLPTGLLALTHLVTLLITGFLATDIFTTRGRFWDDITCKSLIYFYRLMRGLSICTTSLLSVFQAITLSPTSSCLAKLKQKSSRHYLCSLLFLWVFYTSLSSHLVISIAATPNLTSDKFLYITESCSLVPMSYPLRHSFSTLLTVREVFFMGLMAVSSGYMMLLLCRHKKRSQHLHSTSVSPKASPEQRAAWIILLLLSFFLVMTILDSIVSYTRILLDNNPILYCIRILMAHSYATVSPLVLIFTEKRIVNFLRSICAGQLICNYSLTYKLS
ncbi:vomeronasal type-1 receptor 48-like [Ctenodactylus gundi]